ncbi:diguanylate cyclase [Cellvibrio polysaccharolyticus]|uniref:diguanylate cyclase n=1 Tax=Cellvibrio polysaccharolyticus TaxID=2082724 RepID=A0A928V3S4_9GAMM|nr:diguanylate cyclase [Cellvibrio polysaccharolyticus]MBE8717303.1 diguanylate cyclase [Cellvibrio polysaccharolyticus]
MNILLVEDSATLRHAMSQYISAAGHTPVLARSGEEALQMLEDTGIDMVIMDVEMPGLNGFETTRLIREWLGEHWIPIIFVTGLNDDENYREGIEAGGDDYLIKPVSSIIIQAKIRAMERITSMRDQLNRLNQELEALSQLDSLTHVFNRRTFTEKARQQWLISARQQLPLGALMIDVDHFKLYNDHYGHPAGDSCLIKVTEAIKSCLQRPADLLGRYGGEEFIVVLPDTDRNGMTTVANAIVEKVQSLQLEHLVSPTLPVVTVSIGGSSCERTAGFSLEQLIRSADKALYQAKRSGRNQNIISEIASHHTILVAETIPEQLDNISLLFGSHFNLLTTDNVLEAVEITRTIQPDLVIIDHRIAKKYDCLFLRHLKRSPELALTPLLLSVDEIMNDFDSHLPSLNVRMIPRQEDNADLLEKAQELLA